MSCSPIAHDETLEIKILAQDLCEQLVIFASELAIHSVVRAHHCSPTGIKGCFEDWCIDLVLCAVSHLNVHGLTVDLLVIIQKMLHTRNDSMVLHSLHEWRNELAAKKGILTRECLKTSPSERSTGHLNIRTQQHICPLDNKF